MWKEITDGNQIHELRKEGLLYWSSPRQREWWPCRTLPAKTRLNNEQFAGLLEYGSSIVRGTIRYAVLLEE